MDVFTERYKEILTEKEEIDEIVGKIQTDNFRSK